MNRFCDQFVRQLDFLARSCASFDAGFRDEAIRIAVSLRVLLHNTAKSVSLLTHLGVKPLNLLSTVQRASLTPSTFAYDGVTSWAVEPRVRLGATGYAEEVPFDEWWNQVLYVPQRGLQITRRDLILTAANKDGGAHVDASLTPEYEALMSLWVRHPIGTGEAPVPIDNIHLIGLRQLGYEVLHSPEILRVRYDPAGDVDEAFLIGQADRFIAEGDPDSAIIFLRRAAAVAPSSAAPHRQLGILYGQKGWLERARDTLQRAVELSPGDYIARRNLGIALRDLGQLDDAESQFVRAIAIEATDVRSYWGLCHVHVKKGEFQLALDTCMTALEISPDSDILQDVAGYCLLKLGDAEAALARYDKSVDANPRFTLFRINRACALTALGRTEEAFEELAAAIRLDPNAKEAILADEDLASLRSAQRFQEIVLSAEQ